MRAFYFIILAAWVVLSLSAHPAAAFTTDNSTGYANSDGSPKFSDPDDQLDHLTDGGGASQVGVLSFGDKNSSDASFSLGTYQNDTRDGSTSSALK